ncbi:MAG: AAA family ATPase [Actinomycetota bacterium]|nr:AAA family ATPase [Actinomycetota bacterium]
MLSLRLLGGLALEVDGKALPAPGGRCGSLLAWLALHPGMQPRSRVAARLWPDVLDESARRSLRSALLDLRRALGPDVGRYLRATRDEVGLWPLEQVCVDVRAFASAVAEGRLEQALALAQGELLAGFEHDWVYDARDAHREELARAIECLAADAERRGELPTAIAYTRRLVALDPLAEEHARALIRRLSAAQDRAAALAVYDRHRERLRTELGVAPSPSTRELVEQIRADSDRVDASAPPAPADRQPQGAPAVGLPAALASHTSKPLFGRAVELDLLTSRLRGVGAGGGLRCVVLAGEPGVGKTRLVAEAGRIAQSEGATVLYGRCHEDAPFPYAPFVEALRGYVAATTPERLRVDAGPGLAQVAKLVPQLAEWSSDNPTAPADDSAIDGLRLFDAITSLLSGAARSAAVVLALDDLHWADRPTLRVLDHLARAAPSSSILVLGTYRDTELGDADPFRETLARLRRERILEQVRIGGLEQAAVAELARASSEGTPPDELVRAVFEETEGNPYFVEEFMREVDETEKGRPRPIADLLAEIGVPESIQDLIGRRLTRLSDSTRTIVSAASVIGPEFDIEVLARVTATANDALIDALEEALASCVIAELPRAAGRFMFAHILVRDTLYARLSATRRARLHGHVGRAIEERCGDRLDDQLPALARHYELAGDAGKALRYHILAGDAAVRVHAADDASEHYSRALQAAARLGRDVGDRAVYSVCRSRAALRQRTGDLRGALEDGEAAVLGARAAGDARAEIDALNQCGGFVRRFQDVEGAIAWHEAALRVAKDVGDVRAQAATLARLSIIYSAQMRLDEAVRFGDRALQIAQDAGHDDAIAVALDAVKLAALQIGDLTTLDEATARLLALQHEAGTDWRLHWLDDWVLLERAFVSIAGARWEQALAAVEEALRANRLLRNRFAEPVFLDALCWTHRSRGDHERAIVHGSEAVELAQMLGGSEWSAWTNATLGWTMLEAGYTTRAAERLEHGMRAAEAIGARAQLLRCTALLAWASWELGHGERALALADRAEALVATITAPPRRTFLLGAHAPLAVARVRLAAGAAQRAQQLVAPVLAAAHESGWLETIAHASLLDGSCRIALGSCEAGAVLIEDSFQLARDAGLRWVQREAQAKLEELTAARR